MPKIILKLYTLRKNAAQVGQLSLCYSLKVSSLTRTSTQLKKTKIQTQMDRPEKPTHASFVSASKTKSSF
jgi:hypothetical protein